VTLNPWSSTFRFPPTWIPQGCKLWHKVWDWWCDSQSENLAMWEGQTMVPTGIHTCPLLVQDVEVNGDCGNIGYGVKLSLFGMRYFCNLAINIYWEKNYGHKFLEIHHTIHSILLSSVSVLPQTYSTLFEYLPSSCYLWRFLYIFNRMDCFYACRWRSALSKGPKIVGFFPVLPEDRDIAVGNVMLCRMLHHNEKNWQNPVGVSQ